MWQDGIPVGGDRKHCPAHGIRTSNCTFRTMELVHFYHMVSAKIYLRGTRDTRCLNLSKRWKKTEVHVSYSQDGEDTHLGEEACYSGLAGAVFFSVLLLILWKGERREKTTAPSVCARHVWGGRAPATSLSAATGWAPGHHPDPETGGKSQGPTRPRTSRLWCRQAARLPSAASTRTQGKRSSNRGPEVGGW